MFPQVVRTPWHFNAGVGTVHPSIASFRTRVGTWPQAMSGNGMVRPCSCPASDKLARGTNAMAATAQNAIAVIGIDIDITGLSVAAVKTAMRAVLLTC